MAQQTRLETMLPYYQKWMRRFPDVNSLAVASEVEVLSLWEGLGYYSRARNLHRAAQLLIQSYNGQLPADPDAIRALPGIGPYTAGAIASLAFDMDEPAVDGNAARVLARLFDIELPISSNQGVRRLWALAAEHLPKGRAADYNQALMDLGAGLCTPRNPDCPNCPLKADCQAFALGNQLKRPLRGVKQALPEREYAAAIIQQKNRVLIRQRPAGGLLGGMWEFPSIRLQKPSVAQKTLEKELQRELDLDLSVGECIQSLRHTYSHFRARLSVYPCQVNSAEGKFKMGAELRWVGPHELPDYPMGKLDRQIAERLQDDVG